MKASIDSDEWYPVYTLDFTERPGWQTVEVSEEDRADYERVMAEFDAWQKRIDEMWLEQ